jgi:hypothetical protein
MGSTCANTVIAVSAHLWPRPSIRRRGDHGRPSYGLPVGGSSYEEAAEKCATEDSNGGQQLRVHVTGRQQNNWSGLKGFDGGTRFFAAPMDAAPWRKEKLVYIGLGTVVVIIVIVVIVLMLRRR